MKTERITVALLAAAIFVGSVSTGCKSTYNSKRVSAANIRREGTIVWVRPKTNLPLQSLRRRMELTYEQAAANQAGLMQVSLGCRNKSGSDLVINLRTAFYAEPFDAPGTQTSMPVYETNWKRMTLTRGATDQYRATCPKKSGKYYQVTISEVLQ
ncbi:MAG: hypothetical protein HQ559_07380 [Lentisphaerae bacterium]|nr:hypothetical protein [Lentisphaerota bacterium]